MSDQRFGFSGNASCKAGGKNPAGFTLIELLVVIAIIALLMSILMPALSRVKKQAQTVVCKSNLKQWSTIVMMYTNDNSNYFHSGPDGGGDKRWPEVLAPYYAGRDNLARSEREGKIRCCPTATKPFTESGQLPYGAWGVFEDETSYAKVGHYGSFGINWWLCNVPDNPGGNYFDQDTKKNWRSTTSRGANNIPMFADAGWYGVWPNPEDLAPVVSGDTSGSSHHRGRGMKRVCLDRHNGKTDVAFLDMSVRSVDLKELWLLDWHRGFKPIEPDWPEWMSKFKDFQF